jgi:CHAD domain-containing protein
MAKARLIKGINCNAAAAPGINSVLCVRFEEMCALREAALNWKDPEGVHSMRVASRRLRSALRDFMPYLRKRGLTPALKQIKSIASALGDVRDQDVAIMAMEHTAKQAPPSVTAALEQVISARNESREQARRKLRLVLRKELLKQLEVDFRQAVEVATSPRPGRTQALQEATKITFLKMARLIILDRLRELEKLSNRLYKPLEVEALHEMRIAAKRLRYALELFQQCWGPPIEIYSKRAARLQSALGEIHDCDIWIESFGNHIVDAKKHNQREQADAAAWLLSHFIKLRTKHLCEAFDRWREWEAENVSAGLRAALHSQAEQISDANAH